MRKLKDRLMFGMYWTSENHANLVLMFGSVVVSNILLSGDVTSQVLASLSFLSGFSWSFFLTRRPAWKFLTD